MNYISDWILDSPKIQALVSGGTISGGAAVLIDYIEIGGGIFGVVAGGVLSYWLIRNARLTNRRSRLEIELKKLEIAERIELTDLRRDKEVRCINAQADGHYRRKDDATHKSR